MKLKPSDPSIHPQSPKQRMKVVLVSGISVVVLLVFAVFFFIKPDFVGKAIAYENLDDNQAGIFLADGALLEVGTELGVTSGTTAIPVKAKILTYQGTSSVRFVLTYDSGKLSLPTDFCSNQIFSIMDGIFNAAPRGDYLMREAVCTDGSITFEYVGICDPTGACSSGLPADTNGEITVAELPFMVETAGAVTFSFTNFTVKNLQGADYDLAFSNAEQVTLVAPSSPSICGNNLKEGTEVCDGTDLDGKTCVTQGFASGTLGCSANCLSFDTALCINAEVCTDQMDNDGDGSADCADSDCNADPVCSSPGTGDDGSPECLINADCDNNNACDGVEICQEGTCIDGTPVTCQNGLLCQPIDGSCVQCSTDTDCTSEEICQNNVCSPRPPVITLVQFNQLLTGLFDQLTNGLAAASTADDEEAKKLREQTRFTGSMGRLLRDLLR